MPAVVGTAKKNRSGAMMESSLGRKEEEFSVEQVEAVIATLNDKVARLQKDIGALKRTDGSHRAATVTRVPTNLTNARNVDDKSRFDEKKVAKGGRRRESKSFSHDEALADSPESLSRRAAATSNASTSTTTETTTTQQQQRKHALFNGQRKNRPQPQEVNSQVDDRQNTLYPNASDFALGASAAAPPPESSGSEALRNETELGARSIDNKEQQQQDRGASPRNMDEQKRTGVSWREIDNNEQQQQQQQQQRGGLRDSQRYAGVDERNRPPVVKPVTTPHRRSNLNEVTDKPSDQRSLDRDSSQLATGAPKSTVEKFIKHAGQDEDKRSDEKTKKTKKTTKEKATDQKIVDDSPKVRSIISKKKIEDSNANNKKSKFLKFNRKNRVSKDETIKDGKKSSKIASKNKNIPDKNKSSTVPEQAHEAKSQNFSKRIFSKANKNEKNQSKSQKIKNNTKSNDSIGPQYISIKKKLSKCTKELNQLIGKVSNLFRKKSSKNK